MKKYKSKNFGRMTFPIGKSRLHLMIEEWEKELEEEKEQFKIPTSHYITRFLLKLLWIFADDITETQRYMYEIYDNVPEHIKNVSINHIYINTFPRKHRKEILDWLDEDE